jgi:hypothetical protein
MLVNTSSHTQQAPGKRALRLRFSYTVTDGTVNLQLTHRQPVVMSVPPSDRTSGYQGQSGFWFEVRDGAGHVLYRRVVHTPIRTHVEAPANDPSRPLSQVKATQLKGSFELVAPLLDQARTLAIFASPADDPAAGATQILQVNLT